MSNITCELQEAIKDRNYHQMAFNNADPDFTEAAVFGFKAAEVKLDALIRRAKQEKIKQFPVLAKEESCCQEWMDKVGKIIAHLAGALLAACIAAQLYIRFH